jgi:hypothetical protein
LDIDGDDSKEFVLAEHPDDLPDHDIYNGGDPTTGSFIVIDGTGKILFKRVNFDVSLPIMGSNDSFRVAGMGTDGFYCYDISRGLRLYTYRTDVPMEDVGRVVISEWDEEGANVSFTFTDHLKTLLFRSNSNIYAFEEVATLIGWSPSMNDLGSTVGVNMDYSLLYTFQYDDSNVRTDYPSIVVFEENMGIDGLRMYLNGSDHEFDEPLITPFPDPAPIIVAIIIFALFLGRGSRLRRADHVP